MKRVKIKQNSVNFQIENRLSIRKPVSRKKKKTHYPTLDLVLNALLYIFLMPKRGVRKKVE